MITEKKVTDILKKVYYPSTQKNIVELGMVQGIKIEGNKVAFSLIFNKHDDEGIIPVKKSCVHQLETNLEGIKIKGNIAVKIAEQTKKSTIFPEVTNIIAIASGKGGVGKSTISANLAVSISKQGYKVGLLDADIFGPSQPKMFGVEDQEVSIRKEGEKDLIVPCEKYGVKMLSIGFFVDPKQATVWRGPMAGNALRQIMEDGDWGKLDYLLIDLPPGTSDIHLTMVQNVAVTGAIIVSTPQDVALADAIKGLDMFDSEAIKIPVLGLVENMAWFTPKELPNNKYYIFGKGGCEKLANERGIDILGQIPIVQSICEYGDKGKPVVLSSKEEITKKALEEMTKNVLLAVAKRNKELPATRKVDMTN